MTEDEMKALLLRIGGDTTTIANSPIRLKLATLGYNLLTDRSRSDEELQSFSGLLEGMSQKEGT
jgi:hypothetical protein